MIKLQKDVAHGTWDYPFQVHRTALTDGLHLYPHVHEEMELTVITEGSGIFCISGRDYEVKAGEALFVPSGGIHLATARDASPAAFFSIVFSPACFVVSSGNRIYTKYIEPVLEHRLQFVEHISQGEPWARQIIELAKQIDSLYQAPDSELLCQSLLLNIWHLFFKHSVSSETSAVTAAHNKTLREAINYIHANYASKITVKDLARIAHISEGHFSRTFKEYMKTSPMEYLIEVRLHESAKLLLKNDTPVGEIALSCGFNDFSYYGKRFKEKYGHSPKDYRKHF